ncbi:unnamed protein product [Rhodiola kirilowii]
MVMSFGDQSSLSPRGAQIMIVMLKACTNWKRIEDKAGVINIIGFCFVTFKFPFKF